MAVGGGGGENKKFVGQGSPLGGIFPGGGGMSKFLAIRRGRHPSSPSRKTMYSVCTQNFSKK